MKAPVSGTIERFRVEGADGRFRLQVLRRRHGSYKALRETSPRKASVPSSEVASFNVNSLPIRAGDFIGLRLAAGSELSASDGGSASCWKGFTPPIKVGTSSSPNSSLCNRILLYNARIRR